MRQITPFPVWVGHAGDGRAFRQLFDLGIRAVVQVAVEEPAIQTPRELIYLRFPLMDGTGNDPELLDLTIWSVARLIRKGMPCLLCCGAGMSRSPAIVAAALAVIQATDFDECLKLVVACGPADVSPGFSAEMRHATARARVADSGVSGGDSR